jgi:hypothetical protein
MGGWMASMLAQEAGQQFMDWGYNQELGSGKRSLGIKTGASIKAAGGGLLWGSSAGTLALGLGASGPLGVAIAAAAAMSGVLLSLTKSMTEWNQKIEEAQYNQSQFNTVIKERAKNASLSIRAVNASWQGQDIINNGFIEGGSPFGDQEVLNYRKYANFFNRHNPRSAQYSRDQVA